jgi:hypothetical protein
MNEETEDQRLNILPKAMQLGHKQWGLEFRKSECHAKTGIRSALYQTVSQG